MPPRRKSNVSRVANQCSFQSFFLFKAPLPVQRQAHGHWQQVLLVRPPDVVPLSSRRRRRPGGARELRVALRAQRQDRGDVRTTDHTFQGEFAGPLKVGH